MTLINSSKAYEYFRATFSEKEICILEYELRSKKGVEDSERERLLVEAGYSLKRKGRFTQKGFSGPR